MRPDPIPGPDFESALATLAHRGPDARGSWSSADGATRLGCCRLAIVDLSHGADQPMAVGPLRVVHNGEIYNHVELREELAALGHAFRTRSDTEVLGAAYLRWGDGMLERLNGMFAFAVYDTRSRRLLLARDRLGEKPLFYVAREGAFAFASEIKALLRLGVVAPRADDAVVARFVSTGDVPDGGARTFFAGVRQLPPAHALAVEAAAPIEPRRYWRIAPEPVAARPLERFLELFADSVRLRLRADVPVGLTLSGGIDSSLLAGALRAVRPSDPISSFSAVHPGHAADESAHVAAVAGDLGISSRTTAVDARDLERDAMRFMWHQEQPCPQTSQYAQWKVAELAAAHGVKVLLEGQGADELFGGYVRPAFGARWASVATQRGPAALAREIGAYRALHGGTVASSLATLAAAAAPRAMRDRLRRWRGGGERLLWREWADRIEPDAAIASPFADPLRAVLHRQLTGTSLPGLLRYADRSTMAHGIEARLPFLDHRIVAFAFSLPGDMLVGEGWTKRILRDALRRYGLERTAARTDKVGFATPERDWLAVRLRDWSRELVLAAAGRPPFRPAAVEELWRSFAAGRAGSAQVWRVMQVELWWRAFLDRTAR